MTSDSLDITFRENDRVKFKEASLLGAGLKRKGQIGQIIGVHNYPGQGGLVVDIYFGENDIEKGVRTHELERISEI